MGKLLGNLKPWHALFALIVVNLCLALFIGNDYGQTWDEPSFYLYGERSYEAYKLNLAGKPLVPERHIFFLDLRYYGAVYTAIGWKVVEVLQPFFKNWGDMEVWHFVNFVFFQISLVSLYFLAKRFFRPWISFFLVLLFNTQPLIFGHAFINPKDIPFMTFFLASVTTGIYMVDALRGNDNERQVTAKPFTSFSLLAAILFGLFIFTYVGKDLIFLSVKWAITAIYNAPADSISGSIFSMLAGNASRLPVENYVQKASNAHLERIFIYLVSIILVVRKLYLNYVQDSRLAFPFVVNLQVWGWILIAGITLGLATSIRLLAPFAGILIVIYALRENGRNAIPTLITYFSIAAVICMITWPFLWNSPALNFFEAVKVMRDFPYNAEVRYLGDNIAPSNLPWHYLPLLISIQLTEPLIGLAWAGFFVILFSKQLWLDGKSLAMVLWLITPIGLQILMQSNAYDNFRQFLFVLPPIFILSGKGIEALFVRVSSPKVKTILCILCLVPGVLGIFSLHPVQYIYYNSFVGGVSGAEGNFELDYWLTSYRLAAPFINQNASPNANILAWGSIFNGTRKDLNIYAFSTDSDVETAGVQFEYAVISTRFDSNLSVLPEAPMAFEVRKNGALLAVVKKLSP